MDYINELYKLHTRAKRAINKPNAQARLENNKKSYAALDWAINRLDPQIPDHKRSPANQRHLRNTKTYSITMSPEDHDRLVALGKELHIEGGFSGVLTYIAQNCTLIHE